MDKTAWIAKNCKFAQATNEQLLAQCKKVNKEVYDLWNMLNGNGEKELAKQAANAYAMIAELLQNVSTHTASKPQSIIPTEQQ
jgi:hypothetical protein